MAVVLSHQSALDAIRTLRAEGVNMHNLQSAPLVGPSAWVGKHLGMHNFDADVWRWQRPEMGRPIHILVPTVRHRTRSTHVVAHVAWRAMPADSIYWLDENSSVVCPELLFLQMARTFSLPALVMLGHELCGHFSRDANEPLEGSIRDGLPAVTSTESLERYLSHLKWARGMPNARKALGYICDHAISAPEAVLSTMCSLPPEEGGYSLGPVQLNDRVSVDGRGAWGRVRSRYPDLMFSFAPVGLNYDGQGHLDLSAVRKAVNALEHADENKRMELLHELRKRLAEVREKVLDDNLRNRQLAAQGKIVFPVTKEDLSDGQAMDALVEQVLGCARTVYGVDTSEFEHILDDTSLSRDRWDVLDSLLVRQRLWKSSYGKM